MADTAKIVSMLFEEAVGTYEEENNILPLVEFIEPDGANLQVSGDVVWRPVQQHRPIISGWDMSSENHDIIEEAYPAILGTPSNDAIQQRADKIRDMSFLKEAARVSGKKQAAGLNSAILSAAKLQGSLFYRSSATSGYDFVSEAKAIMDERQTANNMRSFIFNNRTSQTFAQDLAGRQTLQGRPEQVWVNGKIGQNIAGFDIYESASMTNLAGGADPATTVTGNQSFKPLPGTVVSSLATGIVTNNDYRIANIVVASSASYNVGDKVTIANSAVPVQSLNLLDKTPSGQAMTFTIVGKPDSTHIQVYPKPIALDDSALSDVEAAYANIDTQILNGATVNRVNIDTTAKPNIFFDKKAIEVIGGTIPADKMAQFSGWKQISTTMKNGLKMYMLYDGNIDTLMFKFRLFTWYGVTIANPAAVGVAISV